MSAGRSNIVAFPAAAKISRRSRQNGSRSVIIVTDMQRDEAVIKYVLDDTGQPPTELLTSGIDALREFVEKAQADIVLIRDRVLRCDPGRLQRLLKQFSRRVPVLILCDEVDEDSTGRYVASGARDVISLDHPKHLRAVVNRECGVAQLGHALKRSQALSLHYKHQVKLLTKSSAQGIAHVRDGSIVGANPAWTELFRCKHGRQLLNTPILDLIRVSQRASVSQLMLARQSGRRRGSVIQVIGECADGTAIPLTMHLERIRVDGQVTIRFTAWADSVASSESSAELDPSTQLYNRSCFIEKFEKQLSLPLAGGVRALAYIRPDRFSKVVDAVGMLESERVIAHLAGILRELAHPADLYGRLGGTVFAVLVSRGSMRDVEAWVEHLNTVIADRPFDHAGKAVQLSCTAGICEATESNLTIETVLREAHDACNHGRLRGAGKAHLSASSRMARKKLKNDSREVNRIQLAVRTNRLRLIRRPVIKLDDSYCKIRDALVRMIDENGKVVLPGQFIPVAERHNLMTMIDRWVIAASVTYCAKRQPDLIFIRLSQDSILDESLTDWVLSLVDASRAKPTQLCFQTTESIATQSLKQTIRQAKRLIKMGFRFAVDQLGTSSETMNILKYVPMQYARIDAALMQGLARDKSIQTEVAEYVSVAKKYGIHTVGECIEDAITLAAACTIGIEYAQGDYVLQEDIVLEDTHTLCMPILPASHLSG